MQTSRRFRFVDDYEVVTIEGKNGRKKKTTRYIGKWVCIQDDAAEHRKKVLETRIAAFVLLIGILLAVGLDHSASRTMYVIVPIVIALFPTVYLLTGLIDLRSSTAPMEKRKFELGIQRIKRSGMGVAVILSIGLLAYLLYRILPARGGEGKLPFSLADIGFLIGTVCAFVAGVVCFLRMQSVATELRENDWYIPKENA